MLKLKFLGFLLAAAQFGCDNLSYEGELTSFTGSTLPIVVLDSRGEHIQDEPKIVSHMKIFADGASGLDDLNTVPVGAGFDGRIGIEIRGHTSQRFPKKQYGFETWGVTNDDFDVSLLGLPPESDWILHAPFSDKSLIRNHFAYSLGNRIGRYSPRTEFVEVFLNDKQDSAVGLQHYRGVYVLTEKIKRGSDRVDIEKLESDEIDEPSISGGYLLEWTMTCRVESQEIGFETPWGGSIVVLYPKSRNITDAQADWILDYIRAFESTLDSADADHPTMGYERYIDVDAFIDYFLLNELMRNHDVFTASTFMFKPRYGKLAMGPLWDFDRSMGNVNIDGNWKTDGWLLPERGWAEGLLKCPRFVERYQARWKELRADELSTDSMIALIDEAVGELHDAPERNFEKWTILGKYVKPNQKPYARTHTEEIEKIKHWIETRASWMDNNITTWGASGIVSETKTLLP